MSLIQETQKKQSQEPEKEIVFEAPNAPAPAPAPAQAESAVPTSAMPTPAEESPLTVDQQLENKQLTDLTQYMQQADPSRPAAPPIPTPPTLPKINLWEDAQKDLGFEYLLDGQLLINKSPSLYTTPFSNDSNVGAAAELFRGTANSAQRREAEAAAQQRASELSNRSALPNLPNATKPWWESSLGWLGEGVNTVLFGSPQMQANAEKRPGAANFGEALSRGILRGEWGRHGAGFGGMLKTGLSTTVGIFNAASGELYKNAGVPLVEARLWNDNKPVTDFNSVTGKTTVVPYRSLPPAQRRRLAENTFNKEAIGRLGLNLDFDYARDKNLVLDVFNLNRVYDDLNDANPNLPPLRGAKPEAPKGIFFAQNRRPGQSALKDISLVPEVINQLFSPANVHLDKVGDAIGWSVSKVFGAAAKPVVRAAKKAGILDDAAEVAAKNMDELALPEFNAKLPGQPNAVRPTVALPSSAPRKVISPFGRRTLAQQITPNLKPAPAVQKVLTFEGGQVQIRRVQNPFPQPGWANPSVSEILATAPKAPVAVAQQVGVGQPGTLLTSPLAFKRRSIQKTLQSLPKELTEGFTGETWQELRLHLQTRGVTPDVVSSVAEAKVELPQQMRLPEQPPTPRALPPAEGVDSLNPSLEQFVRQAPAPDARQAELQPPVERAPGGELATFERTPPTEDMLSTQGLRFAADSFDEAPGRTLVTPAPVAPATERLLLPPAPAFTKDDLLQQFEDLVNQRLLINQPLKTLEDVFDSVVDMGRNSIEETIPRVFDLPEAARIAEVGGEPPLVPSAVDILKQTNDLPKAVEANNIALTSPTLATPVTRSAKPKYTTKTTDAYYHGTAFKDWDGGYNLAEFGSRGELGSGLYLTKNIDEATTYSKAFVGENASAPTRELPIEPGVYEVNKSFGSSSLDARTDIGEGTNFYKDINASLPEEARVPLKRGNKLKYVDFIAKMEQAVAKAGGGENLLQLANRKVSEALRKMGYDSVVDDVSGWKLLLTNENLPKPTKLERKEIIQTKKAEAIAAEAPVAKPAKSKSKAAAYINKDSKVLSQNTGVALIDTQSVKANPGNSTYDFSPPSILQHMRSQGSVAFPIIPSAVYVKSAAEGTFEPVGKVSTDAALLAKFFYSSTQDQAFEQFPSVLLKTKAELSAVEFQLSLFKQTEHYDGLEKLTVPAVPLPDKQLIDINSISAGKSLPSPPELSAAVQTEANLILPLVLKETSPGRYEVVAGYMPFNAVKEANSYEPTFDKVSALVVRTPEEEAFAKAQLAWMDKGAKEVERAQPRSTPVDDGLSLAEASELAEANRKKQELAKTPVREAYEQVKDRLTPNDGFDFKALEDNLENLRPKDLSLDSRLQVLEENMGKGVFQYYEDGSPWSGVARIADVRGFLESAAQMPKNILNTRAWNLLDPGNSVISYFRKSSGDADKELYPALSSLLGFSFKDTAREATEKVLTKVSELAPEVLERLAKALKDQRLTEETNSLVPVLQKYIDEARGVSKAASTLDDGLVAPRLELDLASMNEEELMKALDDRRKVVELAVPGIRDTELYVTDLQYREINEAMSARVKERLDKTRESFDNLGTKNAVSEEDNRRGNELLETLLVNKTLDELVDTNPEKVLEIQQAFKQMKLTKSEAYFDVVSYAEIAEEMLKEAPEATAARARYNADSAAAAAYPEHLTTDANLRDSTYKVLDEVNTQVDEQLEEVTEELKMLDSLDEAEAVPDEALQLQKRLDELDSIIMENAVADSPKELTEVYDEYAAIEEKMRKLLNPPKEEVNTTNWWELEMEDIDPCNF